MNRRTPVARTILIAGTLFLILLSGCAPAQGVASNPTQPWTNALRALDPADTNTPAYDLTAVYLQVNDDNLQIRVDLLDFRVPKDLSLDIRIQDDSAPEATPLAIHIPSENDLIRISPDPYLATVIIAIPRSEIPSHPRVNISTPEDEISGLTLDGPVPPQTSPLLLTFYNTFAGRFPAEALRSWDGAHTGSRGERHGLKHLLDAAEKYQVPVVLLDLKEPANLSALDAMGLLPRIKKLAEEGLLILPENKFPLEAASSPPKSTTQIQILGEGFGLPISPFSYSTATTNPQFAFLKDTTHAYHPLFSKDTYLPIATESETTQPTPDGPSLEVRRALLETALNADEKDLLVLGGDFQKTTWGSPDMVGLTLVYFASRPYIHILSADELLDFPTKSVKPDIQPYPMDEGLEKLKTHYQNLTQPVLDFAKNWGGSPFSTCDIDVDKDGHSECILANETYLAILDPQGARLTYLFSVGRNGREASRRGIPPYTQLIGPSWQVAVGLSNPSTWDTSAGEAADPGAYPGAFTDADEPFKAYEHAIQGNTLTFTSMDGTRTKTFKLTETGIEVEYQTQQPVTTQIPLLIDPDTRFTSGWAERYTQQNTPDGVAWGLEDGPMVNIQVKGAALSLPVPERVSKGAITMRAFNESLPLLATPEDPDFDYPPGHYLPFPMAVAEVEMEDGYFLRLERLP